MSVEVGVINTRGKAKSGFDLRTLNANLIKK